MVGHAPGPDPQGGYWLRLGDYAMANPSYGALAIAQGFWPSDQASDLQDIVNDINDMRNYWNRNSDRSNKQRLNKLNKKDTKVGTLWSKTNYSYKPTNPPAPPVDPPIPPDVPNIPHDPSLPSDVYIGNRDIPYGLSCLVIIGGIDCSDEVVSISAELISSQDEGAEPSKCTIVLHNSKVINGVEHPNYYGERINNSDWRPRKTKVGAIAFIKRVVTGITTDSKGQQVASFSYLPPEKYPIFFGLVALPSYNHELVTIECECALGGLRDAGSKDYSWDASDTLTKKVQMIIDEAQKETGLPYYLEDKIQGDVELIQRKDYILGTYTRADGIKELVNQHLISFYSEPDSEDVQIPSDDTLLKIILYSSSYNKGIYKLDPYVLDPGDCTSILHWANRVVVIPVGDNNPTDTDGWTYSSAVEQNKAIMPDMAEADDDEMADILGLQSIYGVIEAPTVRDPNISTLEEAKKKARQVLIDYSQYKDRDIKVSVATIVPPLLSLCDFVVPDVRSGRSVANIRVKVLQKTVNYDSGGLICHITGKREVVIETEDEYTDGDKSKVRGNKKGYAQGIFNGVSGWYYLDDKGQLWFSIIDDYSSSVYVDPNTIPKDTLIRLLKELIGG